MKKILYFTRHEWWVNGGLDHSIQIFRKGPISYVFDALSYDSQLILKT